MATTITLSVNAQPAISQLYKVNQVINEVKMNGSTFSLGGKGTDQASNGLKKLKGDAISVNAEFAQTQKQLNGIKGSLGGVSQQGKSALRGVIDYAKGLFSVWSAIIIAVELAAKTFTYFWTNLHQTIEKLTSRGQASLKIAQRNQQAADKRSKSATELIQKLEQLNKKQSLNVDEQRLAESIIARLNKQYKDLGITLNQTTGKYENVYEALLKLNEEQKRNESIAIRGKMAAQRDLANAALARAFGNGISLDRPVAGQDFFTLAEMYGGTFGAGNYELLAKMWNTGDIEKQIHVLEQLIQGLSSSQKVVNTAPEALDALNAIKDLKEQLEELNSVDKLVEDQNQRLVDSFKDQRDAIDKTKDAVQGLKDSFDAQQRANSLAQLDPQDRINAIQAEINALQERNDALQKAQELGQEQAKSVKGRADMSRQMLDDVQRALKASQAKVDQKIAQLKRQKQQTSKLVSEAESIKTTNSFGQATTAEHQARERRRNLNKQAEASREVEKKLSAQLNTLEKQRNKWKTRSIELEKQYKTDQANNLKYEKGLTSLEEQRQKNLNQIQQKTQQIAELNKQIEEERQKAEQAELDRLQKQQDAIDDINKSYQKQLDAYNKTPLQQKIEDALQNAASRKGDFLTQDQVDLITYYVTQLEKMAQIEDQRRKKERQEENISKLFKGFQQDQTLAYLKLIGAQKEAVMLEAKLNAQKAKGAKLTEEELKSLEGYINMQELIDTAMGQMNGPRLMSSGTITNELAAKGGFASSVVTDRAQDINAQILKTTNKQYDIQKQIKDAVEKYGVIQ